MPDPRIWQLALSQNFQKEAGEKTLEEVWASTMNVSVMCELLDHPRRNVPQSKENIATRTALIRGMYSYYNGVNEWPRKLMTLFEKISSGEGVTQDELNEALDRVHQLTHTTEDPMTMHICCSLMVVVNKNTYSEIATMARLFVGGRLVRLTRYMLLVINIFAAVINAALIHTGYWYMTIPFIIIIMILALWVVYYLPTLIKGWLSRQQAEILRECIPTLPGFSGIK